jgi:hypothetical protein
MPEKKPIDRRSAVQRGRDYARGMAGISKNAAKSESDAADKALAKSFADTPQGGTFNKQQSKTLDDYDKADSRYRDIKRIAQGGNFRASYGEGKSGINKPSASVQKMMAPMRKSATKNAVAMAKARRMGGK